MNFFKKIRKMFSNDAPAHAIEHDIPSSVFSDYDVWVCPKKCLLPMEDQIVMAIALAQAMPPKDGKKQRLDPQLDPKGYFYVPKGIRVNLNCPVCEQKLIQIHKKPISMRFQ